jgi:hypothetical protein
MPIPCAEPPVGARLAQRQLAPTRTALRPRSLTPIVAMLTLAGLIPAALGAEGKGIRFWNLTSSTIKNLYLSPAGKDAFGPDLCANDPDGAVDHDERLKLTGLAPGRYDLKLADNTGRVCVVRNITVEANKVFSVQEQDLTECTK